MLVLQYRLNCVLFAFDLLVYAPEKVIFKDTSSKNIEVWQIFDRGSNMNAGRMRKTGRASPLKA